MKKPKKASRPFWKTPSASALFCIAVAAPSLMADTHDIASGETTLSGVTETSRTVKNGAGTLVLTGDNALTTLTMNAGTLKINGGTTTLTTSTGGTNQNAPYEQKGGKIIVEGGGRFIISAPNHMVNWNGDLIVTNGVFDASANEFLNGYYSSSGGRMIIQDEGVVNVETLRITQTATASLADDIDIGLFLNAGGKLYAQTLYVYNTGCHGVIRYNGGTIYKTTDGNLYTNHNGENAWDTVPSYVHEGGFRLVNDRDSHNVFINKPLYSGVANDGGVHYSSGKGGWIQLNGTFNNSTFNGGTWLEGNATLVSYLNDASFGAVPESPADNIFFCGSNTLFGGSANYTVHRNRNVRLLDGATATFGCNNSGTGFRIGGEFSVPDGDGAATNTVVRAGNGTWGGFVVFDPGEGRTNRLDRLHVARNLEIASGVTIVRSPTGNGIDAAAPLYVEGNNSAYTGGYNAYGNLKVSGGRLVIEGKRYFEANKYAKVLVSGGTVSALGTYCEYLNGLSGTPATLTVEKGGVFEVYNFRVSQSGTTVGSDVNVNTGGVLRTAYFSMDINSLGRINLNGGTIAVYSDGAVTDNDKTIFLGGRKNDSVWANVTVRVLAGGARFDTDGHSRSVNMPLLSVVGEGETDGGLTKLGEGTLTMTKACTYNGPTRLEGGTLEFTADDGRPGGDIEFSAAGLASCTNAPLLRAKSLAFRPGCGIRVTECDALDADTWQGKWRTAAIFDSDIDAMPSVTFVKSDGAGASTGHAWNNWELRIGADGRSLEFGHRRGMVLVFR